MYRPAPSTTSNHNFSNGHLDPTSSTFSMHNHLTSSSESDLSDPADAPNAPTSFAQIHEHEAEHTGREEMIDTDSLHEDDALGSDDGDFDLESPPPAKPDIALDELSSSEESNKHGKRKTGVEQDEHMMNNPELYGLRRSVIPPLTCGRKSLTKPFTGTFSPIPSHCNISFFIPNASFVNLSAQIDSDSGEEQSGSDIQSGPRKRRKRLVSNTGILSQNCGFRASLNIGP